MVAACDRRPGPAVAACLALEAHDVGRGLRSLASTACAPGRPQSIGGGAMRGSSRWRSRKVGFFDPSFSRD